MIIGVLVDAKVLEAFLSCKGVLRTDESIGGWALAP